MLFRSIAYQGTVHCLTVPGGVFYVRRHKKPVWTGNSIVALYATVLQTDPDTRPVLPAPEDIFSLNQEERFILANPNARYWSIAGSLILQEVPST